MALLSLPPHKEAPKGIGPDVVRLLVGVGGPLEWAAEASWPLHRAIVELSGSVRPGVLLPKKLRVTPRAGVGFHVEGVEAAFHELARCGELALVGEDGFSSWRVHPDALQSYRRLVMRVPADDAAVLYRAGRRWAALASTSLKKLRMASISSGSASRSSTPILRQPAAPGRQ